MIGTHCQDFINFPLGQNVLFAPAFVARNFGNFANLLQYYIGNPAYVERAVDAFEDYDFGMNENLNNFINDHNLSHKLGEINSGFSSSYTTFSIADKACHLFIFSTIYRCLQIASITLHNKAQAAELSTTVKFLCTTAASAIPIIVMAGLGYNCWELTIIASLKIASAYMLPKELGKVIMETTLVSSRKIADFEHIVRKNFLNMGLNFGLFALPNILGNLAMSFSSYKLREKAALGVCISDKYGVKLYSASSNALPVIFTSIIFEEVGWNLGRLFFDCSINLLKKHNLIDDLREPFKNVLNPLIVLFAATPVIKNTITTQQQPPKKQRQHNNGNNSSSDASSYYIVAANAHVIRKRVKKTVPQNDEVAAAPTISTHKKPIATDIVLEDYPEQPLHPFLLNRDTDNSYAYGLIYDSNHAHFNDFFTTLSKASQAGTHEVIKPEGKGTYSLRPPRRDARLLGYLLDTEADVNALFKKCFGSQSAMELIQQMKTSNMPVKIVVFGVGHENIHNGRYSRAIQADYPTKLINIIEELTR